MVSEQRIRLTLNPSRSNLEVTPYEHKISYIDMNIYTDSDVVESIKYP